METDPERGLAELRVAVELFEADPSPFGRHWLEESRGRLAQAEQQIAQRAPLGDVLEGRRAESSEEWNAAVQYGYEQKRYRDVVALTEDTLRDAPELVGDLWGLYNTACCAALLAASVDASVTADERVRARGFALDWLSRDLERWMARVGKGGADAVRDEFARALADPDFVSLRGGAIDELPEAERAAWRELWKRIEAGAAK
jgi:hypothetical protein